MLPKWQFPMARMARVPASATVVATALLLVPLVSMSSATFPGRNGRLAYAVGGGEESYVLRTVKADGTRDRPARPHAIPGRLLPRTIRRPVVGRWPEAPVRRAQPSGPGRYVAVVRLSLREARQADRLELRRPLRLYGWAWARDGQHVVFAAGRAARNPRSRIYTIAIDGSQRRALTPGDRPSWSSDGRHIVFQRDYAGVGLDSARRGVFIIRPDEPTYDA
jgi:hypothetical protein